jgi:hypothetical protein
MTVRSFIGTLAVVLSATLVACGGETTPPQEEAAAPESAPAQGGETVRGDLIKDWERQKEQMMGIADAMPEDKFGYRSTPAQRTFGEQVMHIAQVNVKLLGMAGGKATAPTMSADAAKTKADALKALGESYDYGIALLQEQSDAGITETIEAGFLGESTRARLFWFLLGHSMDIYGQMAVYLRLNDIVPPASRGV